MTAQKPCWAQKNSSQKVHVFYMSFPAMLLDQKSSNVHHKPCSKAVFVCSKAEFVCLMICIAGMCRGEQEHHAENHCSLNGKTKVGNVPKG